MAEIDNLEDLLASGQDNALLRFALGSAFIRHGKYQEALEHLARAVEHDPDYSAAWKVYGKALAECGNTEKAGDVFAAGIAAAGRKGDVQAQKEMQVFLKRLKK